jgi:hypothetical protein
MLILQFLVFAIPVTIAAILHMIVVKINLFAFLKIPLDFGKSFRGKRIFGDHKTLRGVILMILFSIIGVYFLQFLHLRFDAIRNLNILNFDQYSPVFYGVVFGLAYTLAELPNSFMKRQLNIQDGKQGNIINVLLDQFDSPFGCLLTIAAFSDMSLQFFVLGSFFFLFLHMFFNFTLYLLKLRKNPL